MIMLDSENWPHSFEGEQIKDNRKWPSELVSFKTNYHIFHYYISFRKFMNFRNFGLLSLTEVIMITRLETTYQVTNQIETCG